MKLPRLPRFPRLRLPARTAAASPLARRQRLRSWLLGFGLLLIAFVAGFYLFFPTEVLRQRLEREVSSGPATLRLDDLDLLFPPGIRVERALLRPDQGEREVVATDVSVRPLWNSLFGPSPGMRFSGSLQGGEFSGRARRDGSLDLQANGISFAERLTAGSALELAGTLSQGEFTGVLPPKSSDENLLQVTLDPLRLTGMEGLGVPGGELNLGRVVLRGEGRGNNLRITTLEANGGQLQVSGSGSLLLVKPLDRSRLNLNLNLRPGAGFDPALRDLLGLFATPGSDGSYRLRIAGTLESPIFAK